LDSGKGGTLKQDYHRQPYASHGFITMQTLRFRYQTIEFGDTDIHVRTLRDLSQYADVDGAAEKLDISSALWPLFGVIWPSGEVLARFMLDYDVEGKRILEVGCGIALASLVLNQRSADITATDYHPAVQDFLSENIRINQQKNIPFVRTDWVDKESGLDQFDLIIGSDLLYNRSHVSVLSEFINRHAKPQCEVILVDPGRGHHANFSKTMTALGYTHSQQKPVDTSYLTEPFKGQILRYRR
jgi:predicted nicotinamide N-methyase